MWTGAKHASTPKSAKRTVIGRSGGSKTSGLVTRAKQPSKVGSDAHIGGESTAAEESWQGDYGGLAGSRIVSFWERRQEGSPLSRCGSYGRSR